MTQRPSSRQELEASLRSILPDTKDLPSSMTDAKTSAAAAGVGGLFTGYLWGRWQARRSRRRKKR